MGPTVGERRWALFSADVSWVVLRGLTFEQVAYLERRDQAGGAVHTSTGIGADMLSTSWLPRS
eukprot:7649688-Prorocentrum_lima.AAC.1